MRTNINMSESTKPHGGDDMLRELEMALIENNAALKVECRLYRQVELMMARVEIYKSMVKILRQQVIIERKAA